MPVKEGDLEFDAYDCDPERWLEFKQDAEARPEADECSFYFLKEILINYNTD